MAVHPDVTVNQPYRIALTAFLLGSVMGLFIGLIKFVHLKAFDFYMAALALFHFLEYYTTAKYNPSQATEDSFLLSNGIEYLLCHLFAVAECLLEYILFPDWKTDVNSKSHFMIVSLGYAFIVIGQIARTMAMRTAGQSFSHTVRTSRHEGHVLVKNGIYKWIRHPSYFGFFWWAVGTQMIMLNPLSFGIFAIILGKFFHQRIKFEEIHLIRFFGNDYYEYKKSVPVLIPFIS